MSYDTNIVHFNYKCMDYVMNNGRNIIDIMVKVLTNNIT